MFNLGSQLCWVLGVNYLDPCRPDLINSLVTRLCSSIILRLDRVFGGFLEGEVRRCTRPNLGTSQGQVGVGNSVFRREEILNKTLEDEGGGGQTE